MDPKKLNPTNEQSQLQEFYKSSRILITGGTGFVGKALIEKLLRACPTVSKIYVLIRPKNGRSGEQRLEALLNKSVFDRIRMEKDSESTFSKVVCIEGDISQLGLGLSNEHLKKLLDDVTIVFHSAAVVKFNQSLRSMIYWNVIGTQRLLSLCQQMKQLKVLVHVSTAYSNADKKDVREIVYPIPILADILEDMKFSNLLSEELLENVAKEMQQKHPNTYTVTKAIGECVVAAYSDKIPVALVRPSIVTAAWREPSAGWVDNVNGATGVIMEISRGALRSLLADENVIIDLIPVDLFINTLLVSAWHTVCYRSKNVKVYNCTSGESNPLHLRELMTMIHNYSLSAPSKYIQRYPKCTLHTNRYIHALYDITLHFAPSLLMDIFLRLTGSRTGMLKRYYQTTLAILSLEYFLTHQWNFKNENVQSLQQCMDFPMDREVFNVDTSVIDWNTYIKNYLYGIRKYVLKDSDESIQSSRRKLNRLYWVHITLQAVIVALVLTFIVTVIHSILKRPY